MTERKVDARAAWEILTKAWGRLRGTGKAGGLLILGLVGVALLGWGNLWGATGGSPAATAPTKTEAGRAAEEPAVGAARSQEYAAEVQRTLEETLAEVAGAGQVSVRVFLGSGPRYEYARRTSGDTRTTQETDRAGTSRVTSEEHDEGEVTLVKGQGDTEDQPVVVVTHLPEVEGVLVVASGASDPSVRQELSQAVTTALHLPAHRVRVLAKEERR